MEQTSDTLRVDKWLWYARFFKTRAAASKMISSGKFRIDGMVVNKPHRTTQIGHVYTFAQGAQIRVIKVLALAQRRGPAPEAALLYQDMAPIEPRQNSDSTTSKPKAFEVRNSGAGRPTKRDRRKTTQLKEWL